MREIMPSAARQRIPAEMWRSNHNRLSGSSPVFLHSQDIQANPGHCDMSDLDAMKIFSGKRSVSIKSTKRFSPCNKRSGCLLPRRGSTDDLNESCVNSDNMSHRLSTSPDSDSGLYYTCSVLESSNSFALDSVEAPHPSQLPLPPMEWLRPKTAADKGSTAESLHSFLGCFPSAQKVCLA